MQKPLWCAKYSGHPCNNRDYYYLGQLPYLTGAESLVYEVELLFFPFNGWEVFTIKMVWILCYWRYVCYTCQLVKNCYLLIIISILLGALKCFWLESSQKIIVSKNSLFFFFLFSFFFLSCFILGANHWGLACVEVLSRKEFG